MDDGMLGFTETDRLLRGQDLCDSVWEAHAFDPLSRRDAVPTPEDLPQLDDLESGMAMAIRAPCRATPCARPVHRLARLMLAWGGRGDG